MKKHYGHNGASRYTAFIAANRVIGPAAAPVNVIEPTISGTPSSGSVLTVNRGSWTGSPNPAYTFQWQRAGVSVDGATGVTYILGDIDVNAQISCVVTATNASSSVAVTATLETLIDYPYVAPSLVSTPIITGNVYVGQIIHCDGGSWNGYPDLSFLYQWYSDNLAIPEAINSDYTLVTADLDHNITCTVIVSNEAGSASTTSDGVVPQEVQAPIPDASLSIAFAGQSLEEYPFQRGTPRVAVTMGEMLGDLFNFTSVHTMTTYNSGKLAHDGSSENADDYKIRLLNFAAGGSALIGGNTSSAERINGNYWWNDADYSNETGRTEAANTPGPLWRALISGLIGEEIHAFHWSQGTTDAGQLSWPTDATGKNAQYEEVQRNLFAAVRSICGDIPVFINRNGRHQTAANTGYQTLRDIQTKIASDTENVFIAAEEYAERFATVRSGTGTITAGSAVITMGSTSGFSTNTGVEGPGIPTGAYVTALSTNNSITLNVSATVTTAGATICALDGVHLYPGTDVIGTVGQVFDTDGNTKHNETDGFYAVFKRAARAIAAYFQPDSVTYWQGPKITTATLASDRSYIDLHIEHDGGTDLTVANVVTGWRVEVSGFSKTIGTVSKVDANTIRLTMSAVLAAGEVKVWHAFGAMNRADWTKFTRDNANPIVMPLQPCTALIAN